MVRIADIHRVEARDTAATALCQHCVYIVVYQVETPVLRERRDKLYWTVANSPTSEIQPVERAIRCDHVKNASGSIRHWSRGDAVRTEKGALISALTGKYDRAKRVAPQPFARLGVECKYGSGDPCNVNYTAHASNRRNV